METIYQETGFEGPQLSAFSPATFRGETAARRDLVAGRLPRGKVVLLVGAGDVGKSFLLLQALEAINGGASTRAFGGNIVGEELPCIAIMGEDDRSSVDLRMKSIRAASSKKPVEHGAILTAPDIGYMALVGKQAWSSSVEPTDVLRWLEIQIAGLRAAFVTLGFVAIDTFSSLLPVDANNPAEVQKALSLLTAIAAQHDVCIIITHHMRKEKDMGSDIESLRVGIRGSTALVDGVRAAYVMHKARPDEAAKIRKELKFDHNGEVVFLSLVKNNLGLRRDPVTYFRMPDGVLLDVSMKLARRLSLEDALLQVVREANIAGRKITKTGASGLFASKSPDWPGGLYSKSRNDLEGLANKLIEDGRLILGVLGLATATQEPETCQ